MLSKVGTANINLNEETFTLDADKYSTNSSYTTMFSYSFNGTGVININVNSYCWSNSNEHAGSEGARILVDNKVVSESTGYSSVAKNHIVNLPIKTPGTHTVVFQCRGYPATWTSGGGFRQWGTVTFKHVLYPNNYNYGKPTKLITIGNLGIYTFFGLYEKIFLKNDAFDNYLTISDKTTSASTGSIAPGNYVGYITVLVNGEYIKIPYYL